MTFDTYSLSLSYVCLCVLEWLAGEREGKSATCALSVCERRGKCVTHSQSLELQGHKNNRKEDKFTSWRLLPLYWKCICVKIFSLFTLITVFVCTNGTRRRKEMCPFRCRWTHRFFLLHACKDSHLLYTCSPLKVKIAHFSDTVWMTLVLYYFLLGTSEVPLRRHFTWSCWSPRSRDLLQWLWQLRARLLTCSRTREFHVFSVEWKTYVHMSQFSVLLSLALWNTLPL